VDVNEILEALTSYDRRFPREVLQAAIARQEEITPYLLSILEEAAADIDRLVADRAYMAHIYAFYLLAQFREERAYPLLVDLFSIPGEAVMDVTGDFVTEALGRVLASVSGGDLGPMKSLVENESANEYVRAAALTGMLCLFVEGETSREEIVAYFRSLFQGGLERTYSFIWDALVGASVDIYPEELMPEIQQAFAEGFVNTTYVDLPWTEKVLLEGKQITLAQLRESRHHQFIDDTIREMEWWACFDTPAPSKPEKKVGRNDPCPCGSGRKYKHCCLKKR